MIDLDFLEKRKFVRMEGVAGIPVKDLIALLELLPHDSRLIAIEKTETWMSHNIIFCSSYWNRCVESGATLLEVEFTRNQDGTVVCRERKPHGKEKSSDL